VERRGRGPAPLAAVGLVECRDGRGDPAPRSETERKAVCRKRLPGKVFYGYQPSKVLRQTERCGAHGPSAAACASVSGELFGQAAW